MIYEPAEDSYLLAEQVKKFAFGKVLDMGTGSGIQAETAASLKKVKSVIAIDINEEVVNELKKKKIKKIKILKSDLFSNVKEKFDTILFNPPYLPLDKAEPEDSRLATTGGKHGYELLQRFLLDLNEHLTKKGFSLILFSSLTNKGKVEEIIKDIGYEFEELSNEKISFETLYVYKIKRNNLLQDLFNKKVSDIHKFAEGFRGIIYTGFYNKKKVAIKTQRSDVKTETINKEANLIKKLNKKRIGSKLLFSGKNYFVCDFVEGELIIDFLEKRNKEEIKKILIAVLEQCRLLDKIKITKEEMHNPYKHIIIDKKPVMIDFERSHYDLNPKNVTQFCQYVMRNKEVLGKKGLFVDNDKIITLTKEYKGNQSEENYKKIKILLLSMSKSY